jgi:Putative Ig domain
MENLPYGPVATVSGGVSPTVTIDRLPADLTHDASGNISGTPAAGTAAKSPYSVTISASDTAGDSPVSATVPLTITAKCTTPSVAAISPGTSWTQVDDAWADDTYDHTDPPETIDDGGCYLTVSVRTSPLA